MTSPLDKKMKINTKMFVAALAAVALVAGSFAQGAGPKGGAVGGGAQGGQRGPGGGARRGGLMKMDEEVLATLNLTNDQKSRIKALKMKVGADMKAAMQKNQGDREAMKTAFKAAGKSYKEGLSRILSPAQEKQYHAAMKARMAEFRKNHPGGAAGKGKGTPPPSN